MRPDQLNLVGERWAAVEGYFTGLGFASVELDPDGYRRGRMLSLLAAPTA